MARLASMTIAAILLAAACAGAASGQDNPSRPLAGADPGRPAIVEPFESAERAQNTPLDEIVLTALRAKGINPANTCSDAVFVRRAYLDVIGTLPTPLDANSFANSVDPDKRRFLIESLMKREEFADYWALKWGDILRIKSEFPINLWPNAVQAYHRWVRDSIRSNMPCDRFARELLTSSGSNFRVPQVNFYRALQGRQPSSIAAAAALTFMGSRIENWPAQRRAGFESFFSRISFKGTGEWKEEIVQPDHSKSGPLECVFPDGTAVVVPEGADPRIAFADWLTAPGNGWFGRSIANRACYWLMGRGPVHEPDDIRTDNPPSNPDLLSYLEWELKRSGFDMRHLFSVILNSATYQQSSIPQSDDESAAALFAFYTPRQLDAEVLADALRTVCGFRENHVSMIPEPFTFIPPEQRCINLYDGSITSSFLEMFGRPARDTGLESERNNNPSDSQRLFILNSSGLQRGLSASFWLQRLARSSGQDHRRIVSAVYLTILSREPTAAELSTVGAGFEGKNANRQEAAADLAWALMNTKEFLFRH